MLRAIFCLNGPDAVNGPNVWLTRHLPLLAKRGIEPAVLYLSWQPGKPCRFRRELEAAGIRVRAVQLTRNIEDNAAAIAAAAGALEADIFVPNYSVAGYYAARFLRESGVATVGTLHSDDPYYHDIIDTFVVGDPRWRLTGVVGVSSYLQSLVWERTGGKLPYLNAPYGAPVPSRRATWAADRFGLVYSGRLIERQKRVSRVATAMAVASRSCPVVHAVLYGDGPDRAALEHQLATEGGRVRLGGLLPAAEIQAAMLEAQAFVLLSDFEGLSVALMEAMACGLVPIVTPMRSGVADLVRDGETGLIVPPDEPAAFVGAVERLARDGALWRRLSTAARAEVVTRGYTPDGCADAWSSFLHQLANPGRDRHPVMIPPPETWQMPPRSTHPDGIRLEDRRASWTRIRMEHNLGRPVYLWGASRAGEVFLAASAERGLKLTGFIDSDANKVGKLLCGLPIAGPATLRANLTQGLRPFVVITSQFETEIAAALRELGFVEEDDFVAG